jgi:hypothetical protein
VHNDSTQEKKLSVLPYFNCPDLLKPPLQEYNITLKPGASYNGNFKDQYLRVDVGNQACRAFVIVRENDQAVAKVEKSFTIETAPPAEMSWQVAGSAACASVLAPTTQSCIQAQKNIYTLGETVYLNADSNLTGFKATAQIIMPNQQKLAVQLPYTFKLLQSGNYQLLVTVFDKQNVPRAAERRYFAVIGKPLLIIGGLTQVSQPLSLPTDSQIK